MFCVSDPAAYQSPSVQPVTFAVLYGSEAECDADQKSGIVTHTAPVCNLPSGGDLLTSCQSGVPVTQFFETGSSCGTLTDTATYDAGVCSGNGASLAAGRITDGVKLYCSNPITAPPTAPPTTPPTPVPTTPEPTTATPSPTPRRTTAPPSSQPSPTSATCQWPDRTTGPCALTPDPLADLPPAVKAKLLSIANQRTESSHQQSDANDVLATLRDGESWRSLPVLCSGQRQSTAATWALIAVTCALAAAPVATPALGLACVGGVSSMISISYAEYYLSQVNEKIKASLSSTSPCGSGRKRAFDTSVTVLLFDAGLLHVALASNNTLIAGMTLQPVNGTRKFASPLDLSIITEYASDTASPRSGKKGSANSFLIAISVRCRCRRAHLTSRL